MSEQARLEAMMEELGPAFELAAVAYDPSEPLWSVAFDETAMVSLTTDDDGRTAVFALPLAEPPVEAADRAYELLLRFNHLWGETGGTYASLGGDGSPYLICRQPLERLDARRIHGLIALLVKNQVLWTDMLARFGDNDEPHDPMDLAMRFGGIRV